MALPRTERGNLVYIPDGEVLTDWFWDRNRFSCLQGPIGSGSSTCGLMRILAIGTNQEPDLDAVRRTRWIVSRECFDDQTEILTDRGWVLFRDLEDQHLVAQLRDGKTEFVAPLGLYKSPYRGDMLGFEGEGVDFKVTPDHNMYVSKQRTRKRVWGDYEFSKCGDIYGNQTVRVRRDAGWDGVDPGRSPAFFEWLGFWLAEGCAGIYDGRYYCSVTQKNGLGYVRDLFAGAGLPYSEIAKTDGAVNFRVRVTTETRPLIEQLAALGKAPDKYAPDWVKNAPKEHIRALIKGYLAGDGLHNVCDVISTSSKRMADDLQEMALRAGYVANITTHDATGQERIINGVKTAANGPTWFVTLVTDKKYRPVLRQDKRATKYRGWYREDYDGWVYCVEVPTHVVYVRRNGRAFWCSQTYKELRETTVKTWLDWFPEDEWGPFIRSEPMFHQLRQRSAGGWELRDHPSGDGTKIDIEVIFLAIDDPDTAEKVLASYEITGFFKNETQFTEKAVIDELLSRCGRYPSPRNGPGATWFGGWADMNAPVEGHWVPYMRGDIPLPVEMSDDERMAFDKPSDWAFYVQPPGLLEKIVDGRPVYSPNPAAENQKNLVETYMQKAQGKPKSWIDRRILNKVGIAVDGKPVYPTFSEDEHVSPVEIAARPGLPIIVGLDFGRDPAAVFLQEHGGKWAALAELAGDNESAELFAPRVKRLLSQRFPGLKAEFWGDPRGADGTQATETTAFDIFRKYGMRVLPATTDNNPELRRSTFEALLGRRNAFVVNPSLLILKRGLAGGYHYRKIKGVAGQYAPRPVKNAYSHIVEACENGLIGGGEGYSTVRGTDNRPKPFTRERKKFSLRR